jgi:hypothetical protein
MLVEAFGEMGYDWCYKATLLKVLNLIVEQKLFQTMPYPAAAGGHPDQSEECPAIESCAVQAEISGGPD